MKMAAKSINDFLKTNKEQIVWLKLSKRDNVHARFWENFIRAFNRINVRFADSLADLGFPDTKDKLHRYSALLKNLNKTKRFVLVLDDLHCIDNIVIHQLIECTLNNLPAKTTIFILSRSMPKINTETMIAKNILYNIKDDDFKLLDMQIAVWNKLSKAVQNFLVRLSLIDHISFDLLLLLAGKNKKLINEIEKLNAILQYNNYTNAYDIHYQFSDLLKSKQTFLSEKIKKETFTIAGIWCSENGFKIDAIYYFEKIKDYSSIVSILSGFQTPMPSCIAKYAAIIIDRAPKEVFYKVESLAIMHIRSYIGQGLWQKAHDLALYYERKLLEFKKEDSFIQNSLCGIYYYLAYLRAFTCVTRDYYDFDIYIEKFCKHLAPSFIANEMRNCISGPWIIMTGSSRKNAPQEYIDALTRSINIISRNFNGLRTGEDDMGRGELAFYRGDIKTTEEIIPGVLKLAGKNNNFELVHRALMYLIRISVVQGNYEKAEWALKSIKLHRDISISWYGCLLGLPEKVTDRLKQDFSEYSHPGLTENLANQVKIRYYYITKNYPLLLSYIRDMKHRDSILFGRIEMLAIEACVYYHMKLKGKALLTLKIAYDTSSPNEIIMPFIEMGSDMHALCSYAFKERNHDIPLSWLEQIKRKSATYAKNRSNVIRKFLKESRMKEEDNSLCALHLL